MSPRPDVRHERREQILEAATKVFAKFGFSKTRVEDIANESGLSKGALYLYFKSKDEIFGGILDNFFQREFRVMNQIVGIPEKTAGEKLELLTDILLGDLDQIKFAMPIFFEFWSMSFRKKPVRKTFQAYMKNYIDLVQRLFREGIESGEFREGNAYDYSLAFGSLIEGSMVLWSYDPENIELRRLLSTNAEIFIAGLKKH